MKTIYKYSLAASDWQTISVPVNAQILTVQTQYNEPFMWALVDTDNDMRFVKIDIYGTGHPIDTEHQREYLGTFQMDGGILVFHVFKRLEGEQ